jgi:hypothetical protein
LGVSSFHHFDFYLITINDCQKLNNSTIHQTVENYLKSILLCHQSLFLSCFLCACLLAKKTIDAKKKSHFYGYKQTAAAAMATTTKRLRRNSIENFRVNCSSARELPD